MVSSEGWRVQAELDDKLSHQLILCRAPGKNRPLEREGTRGRDRDASDGEEFATARPRYGIAASLSSALVKGRGTISEWYGRSKTRPNVVVWLGTDKIPRWRGVHPLFRNSEGQGQIYVHCTRNNDAVHNVRCNMRLGAVQHRIDIDCGTAPCEPLAMRMIISVNGALRHGLGCGATCEWLSCCTATLTGLCGDKLIMNARARLQRSCQQLGFADHD